MDKKNIEEKIKKFEYKFNEREDIDDVQVNFIKSDDDYYYADVILIFDNYDIEAIYECKYPKKLITLFEE